MKPKDLVIAVGTVVVGLALYDIIVKKYLPRV